MSEIILENIRYFDGSDSFKYGTLYIKDGIYTDAFQKTTSTTVIDGSQLTALPGLIDSHLHGCNGYDVCDNSITALKEIARFEKENGIAYFLPTTMTLPIDTLKEILGTISSFMTTYQDSLAATALGIHLEGPFLSAKKCGAQNASHLLSPDFSLWKSFQTAANGMIRITDLAPELPGAMDFIKQIKETSESIVSIAHTNADYDCTMEAFHTGASHVTHTFNAMPSLHHRLPGTVGAAFDYKNASVELICDGIHIHPSMLRAAFCLFDCKNIIFISDSMRATGLSDGTYILGDQSVMVNNKKATLASDGSIAGSVSTLLDCLRYAVKEVGIKEELAICCATTNPARILGMNTYGSTVFGSPAKLILVNENYKIIHNLL